MPEDSFSAMSAVVTTITDDVQTTNGNTETPSSTRGAGFYFQYVVVVIGIVGAAANALVLYAMVASKQHKKQLLIFNQNVFDLCSSVLLIITYTMRVCNIYLTGTLGYWLCILILSDSFLWASISGSAINLMSITIEHYIKVVHSNWSKKLLHKWVKCSAAAFAWIAGLVYDMTMVFLTTAVIDRVCYGYLIWKSKTAAIIYSVWSFVSFYIIAIFIFVYCYGNILVVLRCQARVMAGHSGPGPSTSQNIQSNHIQSGIIKTMILVSTLYVILYMPNFVVYQIAHMMPGLAINDTA